MDFLLMFHQKQRSIKTMEELKKENIVCLPNCHDWNKKMSEKA
ncbi:hypothetical protein [Ruminococcus sp.]|nr:hypothetical protein [Ruminococcus sp.]